MNKYIFPIVLFFVLVLSISACSNTEKRNPEFSPPEDTVPYNSTTLECENEVYKKDINELVKIEIPVSELNPSYDSNYVTYRGQRKNFDFETVKNILMQASKIKEEAIFQNGAVYNGQTENEMLSIENPGSLSYRTSNFSEKIDAMLSNVMNIYSDEYDPNVFISSENLPFMTQDQACEKAVLFLNELCDMQFQIEKIYTLEKNAMQKKMDSLIERGAIVKLDGETLERKPAEKIVYTDSDNCYYIRLREAAGNLTLFDEPHGNPDDDTYIPGSFAEIAISEDGIVYLYVSGVFDVSDNISSYEILSVDSALKSLIESYNQIIPNNNTTVTGVKLIYLPEVTDKKSNEYILTPAWHFTTQEEVIFNGETHFIYSFVLLNAVTGKEIL